LPGDSLFDSSFVIPEDIPEGYYKIQVGIVDRNTYKAKVKLAMVGLQPDGWCDIGIIKIN